MSTNRVKKSVNMENELVTFAFENETVEFKLADLSAEMVTRLALHGLSQKLGDSYADSTKVTDPQSAASVVWENLLEGNWGRERASVDYDAAIVEAKERLESYIYSSDEEKRIFAKMKITREMLEKAVKVAEKAKEKALKTKK